jgi:hypothetical protein
MRFLRPVGSRSVADLPRHVREDRPKRIHGHKFILAHDDQFAARVVIYPDAVFPVRFDGYISLCPLMIFRRESV